tara:strand:- start:1178 stop:1993 length:816 start_codon:yes stop_codon:yes gene_type:complete
MLDTQLKKIILEEFDKILKEQGRDPARARFFDFGETIEDLPLTHTIPGVAAKNVPGFTPNVHLGNDLYSGRFEEAPRVAPNDLPQEANLDPAEKALLDKYNIPYTRSQESEQRMPREEIYVPPAPSRRPRPPRGKFGMPKELTDLDHTGTGVFCPLCWRTAYPSIVGSLSRALNRPVGLDEMFSYVADPDSAIDQGVPPRLVGQIRRELKPSIINLNDGEIDLLRQWSRSHHRTTSAPGGSVKIYPRSWKPEGLTVDVDKPDMGPLDPRQY